MGETDLISRQAVIDAIDSFILDEVTDVYGDTVREILERLPTIEERKTAKWISDTDDEPVVIKDGFPDKSCYCSECREWLVASDEYAVKGNFCPNCGSYNGGDSDG